jgi:hypothetical protein
MSSEPKTSLAPRRRRRQREDGAVMLVVMLVVLIVTAAAMFAVHSTTFEIRSAGTFRQAMQTQYLAEGSLTTAMAMIDSMGAGTIDLAMQRVPIPSGRQFTAEEPAYGQSTPHFRAYMADFATMPGVTAPPVETSATYGGSFGSGMAYVPDFMIDINDSYRPGRTIAGMSATGDAIVSYRVWTITSRGRTHLPSGDYFEPAEPTTSYLRRGAHDTAMNSRALVISGPMAN